MATRPTKQLPGDLLLSLSTAPGLTLRSPYEKFAFAPILNEPRFNKAGRFINYQMLKPSPDGTRVALVSTYNSSTTIYVAELADGCETFVSSSVSLGAITDFAWSPDGSEIAVASATSPYIFRLNSTTLAQLGAFTTIPSARANTVAYSTDGALLFGSCYGSTAPTNSPMGFWAYNIALNDLIVPSNQANTASSEIATFPNGKFLFVLTRASSATGCRVFDVRDFSLPALDVPTTLNHSTTVQKRAAFSADGEYLVTLSTSSPFLRVAKVDYGAGAHTDVTFTLQTLVGDTTLTGLLPYVANWATSRAFFINCNQGVKLCTINGDDTVSIESLADLPGNVSGVLPLANFAKRKFAGSVVDGNAVPLKREIRAVDKETGRFLASTFSDETTGVFELIVTSSNPAIVQCIGEGGELTQLADGVIPVPL